MNYGLPTPKLLKKSLQTKTTSTLRLAFCQKYRDWTTKDGSKIMFLDEFIFLQFASYKLSLQRPSG